MANHDRMGSKTSAPHFSAHDPHDGEASETKGRKGTGHHERAPKGLAVDDEDGVLRARDIRGRLTHVEDARVKGQMGHPGKDGKKTRFLTKLVLVRMSR